MPDKSYLTKLINCEAIGTQPLRLPPFEAANLSVDVLRLDLIHPVISGNKYFKLKIAVANAIDEGVEGIVSFGGAYSNHLVALAFLCRSIGLACIGIVRGEEPAALSETLKDAIGYGMKPIFVSRDEYSDKEKLKQVFEQIYPGYKFIPEGGQSAEGVLGATEIYDLAASSAYDIITCAVGTGTMMAGLLSVSNGHQLVLGISALKLPITNDVEAFIRLHAAGKVFAINYDYHFGGYARKSQTLIDFMNGLWENYRLPTDFVYTAKLVFGVHDLAEKNYFPAGSRILIIHSGGLQGNRSIADKLNY